MLLDRYFPEIVEALLSIESDDFGLDGGLVVPVRVTLSFAALRMRLHPAESRIRQLTAGLPYPRISAATFPTAFPAPDKTFAVMPP